MHPNWSLSSQVGSPGLVGPEQTKEPFSCLDIQSNTIPVSWPHKIRLPDLHTDSCISVTASQALQTFAGSLQILMARRRKNPHTFENSGLLV